MRFEWDEAKDLANQQKHAVSFTEAQEAFFDVHRLIIKDDKHSSTEDRYFCIGKTENGILTVRFTMRGTAIRLIGAGYWREGRSRYEEEN